LSGKIWLKIIFVTGLAASLFFLSGLLVQTAPLNSYAKQHYELLLLINMQGAVDPDCEKSESTYVPNIRRNEDREPEQDSSGGISIPVGGGGGGLFDVISWLFIIGIAVLAVVLLTMLVNYLFGARAHRGAGDENQLADGDDLEGMAPLKENPLMPAEGLAQKGDYRTALRILYRGILGKLIKLGIIDADKNRTNWEVMGIVRSGGHSEIYQTLVPVTQLFDRAWYGQTSISADEYHKARDATEMIMKTGEGA